MNARRLYSIVVAALCALFAVSLFSAAGASAAISHSFVSSFGSGSSTNNGLFQEVQGIAVDESGPYVYVFDRGFEGGTIFKFNAKGEPFDFTEGSGAGTNMIKEIGAAGFTDESELAVDNDPLSPAKGDIYVVAGEKLGETVAIYSSSGKKIGALTAEVEQVAPKKAAKESWGDPCGVATDASGNVYVGSYHNGGVINKYTPSPMGNPVTNTDYVSSLWGVYATCNVAADSTGVVFATGYEDEKEITAFPPSQFNIIKEPAKVGEFAGEGKIVGPGPTMAVDPSSDDLYVDTHTQINQYGPHGVPYEKPIATFATEGEGAITGSSWGVVVDGTSGDIYFSDGAGHISVFGPGVLVPDVTIEPPSNIGTTKATVTGTVNPDGVPVTTCVFEYGVAGKYTHSVPCPSSTSPGSGSSPVTETVELTGLEPSQEYTVRLSASNAQGRNVATPQKFRTLGPPTVSISGASAITKTSATLHGEVSYSNGFDTTYHFEYGPTSAYGTNIPVPSVDIGTANSVPAEAPLTGLTPGTEYHARLVATNSAGTTSSGDMVFQTVPVAVIQAEHAANIGLEEATFQARIGPLGDDTHYHFEYGPTSAYGSSVPVPDGDVGAGSIEENVLQQGLVSQRIGGLQPDTVYHYRTVATNALGTVEGKDRTFTTVSLPTAAPVDTCPNASFRAGGPSEALPDCRAYEMVTPLDKNGSNIGASTYFASQSSSDGERVSFLANSGFAGTVGSGHSGLTDYIAARGPEGWSSRSITPPSSLTDEERPRFQKNVFGYTEDLSRAIVFGYDLPGADPGTNAQNFYREDTASRALETVTLDDLHCECLGYEELLYAEEGLVGYSSSDAGVVAFQTTLPLLSGTLGHQSKLYEWAHGTLRLGGILPDGTIPAGGSRGAGGKELIDNHGSVSSDGSRVLFVSPTEGSSVPQLYMRKNGTSTVWLSRSWSSTPDPEPAGIQFQAASADGTKVLFTSTSRLLNSDTGEGEIGIYLYTDTEQDPESEGKLKLIERVNGKYRGNNSSRGVVAGMSEDATHIYFFNGSYGVTGRPVSAIPHEGEYLWDNGTLHFVAPIVDLRGGFGIDPTGEAWTREGSPVHGEAVRVSSDGRRMAFLWRPRIAGPEAEPGMAKPAANQDNTESGHVFPEYSHLGLYVYDEGSEKLACVSCPPDGAPMTSDVSIASRILNLSAFDAGGFPFFQRYMSSDGRYVFFTTSQSLVPQDTNGLPDVYEYDVDAGELKLISSGTGEDGSWFEDASANGSDVFFLTAQKLTGWDTDTLTDLYDARIGGGFPEPPAPPVPCDGDACHGIPSAVPSFNTASGFTGLGNASPLVASAKKARAKPKKHAKHAKRSRGAKRRKHGRSARRSRAHGSDRSGR